MYPLIDLSGKKIVVVGASKGIGKKTAEVISEVGAQCMLVSRNEEDLKNVLDGLSGSGHAYMAMDISDTEGIECKVQNMIEQFGAIDGLAYVAGITDDRPLKFLKPSVVDNTMRINYGGFIEFVRCVTKRKMFNKGLRIVGVSSTAAFAGTKAHTIYSSSKAAMNAAVRCLVRELGDKGIAINAIAPSMIKTEMYEKWLENNGNDGFQVEQLNRFQYLGVGEKEDVANGIAFLLSPASKFITGACLIIDGGGVSN